MICRGAEAGVKALRPRSGTRERGLDSGPASAMLWTSGEYHFSPHIVHWDSLYQPEQPPNDFGLSNLRGHLHVSLLFIGAGRGGRTPTRLPSADFEFPEIAVCL